MPDTSTISSASGGTAISPRRHSHIRRIGRFSGSLGDGISMRNPKIFGSSYQVPVLETSKTVACTCHLCRVLTAVIYVTADIVILLLNPGFGFTDYYSETCMPQFRCRLEKTLAQDFSDMEFPFVFLDPEYCWHGGFHWWEEKLRDVTTIIARKKFKGSYLDALRCMSKRLASLELIPYHSSSFNAHRFIKDLHSVRAARQLAQEMMKEGKRTIIITRQVKLWEPPRDSQNLIIYKGGHTRGASLGSKSCGGKAILKRYGISAD